ncbi:MAG: exodeoxyribonuclease VII large subunit [Pirellulales bacterium]
MLGPMFSALPDPPAEGPSVFSISAISELLRTVVSETFGDVWVVGEISNCLAAGSGHCYLTLKDSTAQLRAVIWRNTAQRLKFRPEDGMEVIARGRLDVYAPRGDVSVGDRRTPSARHGRRRTRVT